MRHLLTILAALLLCAPAQAQTLKSLMFNATNGQVVANRTNTLRFNVESSNGGVGFYDVANQEYSLLFPSDDAVQLSESRWSHPSVRANLGFSTNLNTLWTATNASNARSAIGLGATWLTNTNVTNFRAAVGVGPTNDVAFNSVNVTNAAATRTNIGLPLAALTNTSNVTMMRALAGSTNTNQPFSGSFAFTNPDNNLTYTAVVSNGIILEVYEY